MKLSEELKWGRYYSGGTISSKQHDQLMKRVEQLEVDAELGKLVRKMPYDYLLARNEPNKLTAEWQLLIDTHNYGELDTMGEGKTPEDALLGILK